MSRSLLLFFASFALTSCGIEIPDAEYTCVTNSGCPSGFVCSVGYCRRHAIDADVEVDSSTCVAETCNGVDDDCDGFVDDGVLALQGPTPVAGSETSDWATVLPDGSGGRVVLFVKYDMVSGGNHLYASHFDVAASLLAGPTELGLLAVSQFQTSTFGPNFHVVYTEATTNKLVLQQFSIATLAQVGATFDVSTMHDNSIFDLVDATTASGDQAYVIYTENQVVKMRAVLVPAMTAVGVVLDLFTPSGTDPAFDGVRITAAPCGRMLFAVLHRIASGASLARIVPITPYLQALTPGHDVVPTGTNVVSVLASPVVVGGSCLVDPSSIAVAWGEADVFGIPAASSEVHLDTFAITTALADPKVTFTSSGRTTITPPPNFIFVPQAIFVVESPLALTHVADGRFYVSAAIVDAAYSVGQNDIYEVLPDGTYTTTILPTTPKFAVVLDALPDVASPTDLVFTTAETTDDGTTRQYSLGCTPP